ncbi:MAG: EamA family transporter [Candidatus Neomarinimicrobiota bacterium]|jgi:drug/metabolite transporter (DMT)-like permease|nr:EamA family transporter [Candidatus Neomarinimicrobiota bacterium]MEE2918343.1 EamA family transporter [Candidatus Neomarinimicrobiota bacterium]HIB78944.1 EamA family transporter [Candidatus Neomarinimicrobiota bacterium]|tara:strand:+ start:245 stop:1153 length:909 start_codon:yes stop_codon:yes gene_type:complete
MKKYLPALAVIFAAFLWSFDGFIRQNLFALPSFLIVSLEHVIGAILFLPLLIRGWKEVSSLGQRGWISVLWISIFGGVLGTFFYTKALSYVNYIDLSVVVLLQKLQPIFAIALAGVILKEKITKRFIILAFAAIVGGYLVTFGSSSINDWDDKTIIAALLALLAAFSWGSSTVLGKHALNRLSFTTVTSLRLAITASVTAFVLLSTGQYDAINNMTLSHWGFIVLIVLSTGSLALFFYYYGLNKLPASHATLYELFWPLSAVGLDWFIRGNILSLPQWVGAILLLGAIIILTRETNNGQTQS